MAYAYARQLPCNPKSRLIRVFDLRSSQSEADEIQGHLREVSLDDNPSYDALSYAWGDPSPPYHFLCDGKRLKVTANCYDALHQLRRRPKTSTIWVDSICINQSDEIEKAHQVSLMKHIFSKARKVYIRLEKGTPESDYAFDWLNEESSDWYPLYAVFCKPFPLSLTPREFVKMSRVLLEGAMISLYRLRPWKQKKPYNAEAMEDIMCREWFKRMWTIQEAVMAREPIVVCGNKTIRFANLALSIMSANSFPENRNNTKFSNLLDSVVAAYDLWLNFYILTYLNEAPIRRWLLGESIDNHLDIRNRFLDFLETNEHKLATGFVFSFILGVLARLCYGLPPLRSWLLLLPILFAIVLTLLTPSPTFKNWEEQHLQKNLVWVLHMTRIRQSTNEVDRVFALYGLFQELRIPLGKPDYKKSVGEVYLDLTRTVIEWHGSLGILFEASAPWLPDSPSWVPDWSRPFHPILRRRGSAAANNSTSKFTFSACGRRLTVSGIVVDTVMFCSGPLQEMNDTSRGASPSLLRTMHNIKVLSQWISHTRQLSNTTYTSIEEALFETVHSETDFRVVDQKDLRQLFNRWFSILTADYSDCLSLCPVELACALSISMDESLNRYHHERCRSIAGKKVFLATSNGHVGAGLPSVLVSDCIALISGVEFPMVVRPLGTHHQVVGPAYVHGMMCGEAWPKDETNLQDLTLV